MKLYDIPGGDTVIKARVRLKQVGWKKLLNKTAPTWRQLPDTLKSCIKDDSSSMVLMLTQPYVINRPVLERKGIIPATDNENRDL